MGLRRIAVGLASLALAAAPAVPASAHATGPAPGPHAVQPHAVQRHAAPAGWNGRCYTNWHTSTAVNMWCDGRGPERYGVSAVCTKGRHTYQYNSAGHPWFGDRRGATVRCRKGKLTTWWGYPAN